MEVIRTYLSLTGRTIGNILSTRDGYAFDHFSYFTGELEEHFQDGFQTQEEAEEAWWVYHDEVNGN